MSKCLQGMLSARVLFSVLILVVCSLAVVPDAYACPPTDIEWTYYTDASKTVACGWKYTTCYCSTTSSGCRTSFYDITYWECPLKAQADEANPESASTCLGKLAAGQGESSVCKDPENAAGELLMSRSE